MAGAPTLPADARCVAAASAPRVPDIAGGPGTGRRTARRDRLVFLLPVSLLLHLALLAWPYSGRGIDGALHAAARGAQLTATLAGQRASAGAARQAPATIQRTAASDASPTPREPATDAAAAAFAAPLAEAEAAPPLVAPPARPQASLFALAPTTLYYPAEHLTTRPRALAEPLLDPQELAAFVASGEIALALWIDEHGQVTELDVERSDLPAAFVQAATAAFKDLRFAPGEIDGQPVGSVLRIAVRYDDERLASDRDAARQSAVEPAS